MFVVDADGRLQSLAYPLGLPGSGSAGKDLLCASDVGGSAGQGVSDELGPVDRQRRAGDRAERLAPVSRPSCAVPATVGRGA